MKLRTANHNRKRAHRLAVYAEAFAYHHRRVQRLMASDRGDKLANSGFARRQRKRTKATWVRLGL